eukprot:TRINITY_DN376_c0_g1_i1.p1 TRINITY_DN376_c0_g1~~TRINITY_DN376_c0_g1_i1.p1  ORF type:complete len:459 (+),score=103.91 TRINITY_DN376_c0_g1_i1:220-1596(+)
MRINRFVSMLNPRVHIIMLLVTSLFGALNVFGKIATAYFTFPCFVLFRLSIAVPFMILFASVTKRRVPSLIGLVLLVIMGVVGAYGSMITFTAGLQYADPDNAAILMTTIPAFTTFFGWLMRMEGLGVLKIIGILVSIAGAVVVLGPGQILDIFNSLDSPQMKGNLLLLTSACALSLFLAMQRRLMLYVSAPAVTAWCFSTAWVVAFVSVLFYCPGTCYDELTELLPWQAYASMAFVAVACTAGAFLLVSYASQHGSPTIISCYTSLEPVATFILAYFVLNTNVIMQQYAGTILVCIGLVMVIFGKRQELTKRMKELRKTEARQERTYLIVNDDGSGSPRGGTFPFDDHESQFPSPEDSVESDGLLSNPQHSFIVRQLPGWAAALEKKLEHEYGIEEPEQPEEEGPPEEAGWIVHAFPGWFDEDITSFQDAPETEEDEENEVFGRTERKLFADTHRGF